MTYTAEELTTAVREAITLGLEGEAIAGIDLLVTQFPELTEPEYVPPSDIELRRILKRSGHIPT